MGKRLQGSAFRRPYGLLVAAAFFWAAAAPAAPVKLAAAAGVFPYYAYDALRVSSRAGPAAALACAYERDAFGLAAEVRYRRYGDGGEYEAGAELRARYYFHPAPARPYVAPTTGFWLAGDGVPKYKVIGVGARAGGVLTAEGAPLTLDVFAAYRGRFNLDRDERRPAFTSELAAGATCDWFLTAHFGLHAEASVLWPGIFAEKHEPPNGPGVAPFVLVGPAFSF